MKCPRCAAITHTPIVRCPGCGFSIETLDRILGSPAPLDSPLDDEAALLSAADHAALTAQLNAAATRSHGRLIVATRLSTAPVRPAEYAFWLFNRPGLVSPGTRGLLILLAVREQRIETEVGTDWEELATDLQTGRVLDREVLPLLRERDYAGALRAAATALEAIVAGESTR